jgi:hypothetical protein
MKRNLLSFLGSCTVLAIPSATFFSLPNKISTAQTPSSNTDLNILYENALLDAADPQDNQVLNNLTVIDKSNQNLKWEGEQGKSRIQVVTFTTEKGYGIGSVTPPPEGIWVTVVPDLHKFCHEYLNTGVDQKQLNLRLTQLLGLPPEPSSYTHIAEIWVDTQFLKRPSLDPEINDETVQTFPNPIKYPLPFSQGADSAYQAWFTNLIMNRKISHYPFTGLGYTYDWEPKTNLQNHAGLSEFIILPNSQVEVTRNLSTKNYCEEN